MRDGARSPGPALRVNLYPDTLNLFNFPRASGIKVRRRREGVVKTDDNLWGEVDTVQLYGAR